MYFEIHGLERDYRAAAHDRDELFKDEVSYKTDNINWYSLAQTN